MNQHFLGPKHHCDILDNRRLCVTHSFLTAYQKIIELLINRQELSNMFNQGIATNVLRYYLTEREDRVLDKSIYARKQTIPSNVCRVLTELFDLPEGSNLFFASSWAFVILSRMWCSLPELWWTKVTKATNITKFDRIFIAVLTKHKATFRKNNTF
jgi:hypothetical protein